MIMAGFMLCCAVPCLSGIAQMVSHDRFRNDLDGPLAIAGGSAPICETADNNKIFRNVQNFENLPSSSIIGIFSPPSQLYRTRTDTFPEIDESWRQKGFVLASLVPDQNLSYWIHIGNNLNSDLCKVVPPQLVVYAT